MGSARIEGRCGLGVLFLKNSRDNELEADRLGVDGRALGDIAVAAKDRRRRLTVLSASEDAISRVFQQGHDFVDVVLRDIDFHQ